MSKLVSALVVCALWILVGILQITGQKALSLILLSFFAAAVLLIYGILQYLSEAKGTPSKKAMKIIGIAAILLTVVGIAVIVVCSVL